jgi:lysophospholipase L1-like esterase
MRKIKIVLVAAWLAAAGAVTARAEYVVLCMGDSITQGRPEYVSVSYPIRLQRNTGVVAINAGVGGVWASYGLSIVDDLMAQVHPDCVLILYGTNDINSPDQNLRYTANNLLKIAQRVRAGGSIPVIGTVPPMVGPRAGNQPRVNQLNGYLRTDAPAQGFLLADIQSAFGSGAGLMTSDGFHPNDAGMEVIAQTFAAQIRMMDIAPTLAVAAKSGAAGRAIAVESTVAWTASSGQGWISFASGTPGSGLGTVRYNVAAQAAGTARTGTITVAGGGLTRTCKVVQSEKVDLKINCGSTAIAGWQEDVAWKTVSGGANGITTAIAETGDEPQLMYQTRRYGSRVTYHVDLPDGRYDIRLHFADLFASGPDRRIFDVKIEGATVLPNYDIVAAAGAPKQAVVEEFADVEVSGGLQIEALAKKSTAQFNGIEIRTAGPRVVANPTRVSVPEGGTAQFGVRLSEAPAGDVTVAVARVSGDADISVQAGATLVFTPANFDVEQTVTLAAAEDDDGEHGTAAIRCEAPGHSPANVAATEQDNDVPPVNLKINCGSGAVGEWGADQSWSVVSGGANYTTAGIADTGEVPEAVYQYRRYGSRVTYNLDIPDGRYHVRLHFADLFSSGTGKRIFDVRMEGATVLPNYDIVAAAGAPKRAVAELFEDVEVSGGLQLEVVAKLNTAQFNAIEVWTAGPAVVVSPTAVLVPEGGAAQFGVRLSDAPTGDVTVAVAWVSGDADISVQAGAALVFTPANYDVEQTVTLSAAEDDDGEHGVAVIRCTADGFAPANVTATEQDNDVPPVNLKINCGSGAVGEWGADQSWSVVSGGANYTTAGVADTGEVPEAVYQYRRYGSRVTYNLDIPDGRYHVRLHFADLFSSGTGKRIFDVRMEGATVLPNYDIIAAAGAPKRAVAELFEDVEVSGGLQLEVVAKLNTAQFNAIEVWTAGPAVVVNPASVSVPEGGTAQFAVRLSDAPTGDVTVAVAWVSGDADISVTGGAALVFTPANYDVEQTVTLSAAEDDDGEHGTAAISCAAEGYASANVTAREQDNDVPPVNLKINCGSGAVGEWGADQSWSTVSGGANYTTAGVADTGEVPEAVYQYRRYGSRVTYNLDIPDGRYNIRLHFADLFSTGTGKRIFDVSVEGAVVRPDYDIIAAAGGPKRAVAELFENVEVSGGLQLEVVAKVNTAQFNAIEVWSSESRGSRSVRFMASGSGTAGAGTGQGLTAWPLAWAKSGEGAWSPAPALVDGDMETVWTGEPGAGPWSVAVDVGESLLLGGAGLLSEREEWVPVSELGSCNATEWFELDWEPGIPIQSRILYFILGADGTGRVPAIREILWEEVGPDSAP